MSPQPLVYRDFDVEMADLRPGGRFRVRVLGPTPGGEMPASAAETPTYRADDFTRLLGKLERRKATKDELIELGEKLAALLLPGRVGRLYEDSLKALPKGQGLRLRLRVEPLALAALPWEYTFVPRTAGEKVASDFLALRREVSVTRYEALGPSPEPVRDKQHVRIVVALANPLGTPSLNVEADKRAILAAVNDLRAREPGVAAAVEAVVVEEATRERLLAALPGADIFHFAGHGVFEGTEMTADGPLRKRGKIILETDDNAEDRYASDQLAVNLANAGVRLAVLGACSSAARDEGGAWTGVAPALVRENLPAVLAMHYPVQDLNAARFMAHLYTRLLGGYTIDEAVFEGRQALFSQAGLENRDWGLPVLYLRARDGLLFPLAPEGAGARESPFVLVQRKLGQVLGEVIGAQIDAFLSGRVEVRDAIDVVGPGGKAVGVKIGTLGGTPKAVEEFDEPPPPPPKR